MRGSVIYAQGMLEVMDSFEEALVPSPHGLRSPVDMHVHTIFSDGSLTPEQVAMKALSLGVETLIVADHDTLDGKEEVVEALNGAGINTAIAVELNCVSVSGRNMDILGYCIDPENRGLRMRLSEVKQSRRERVEKMAALFNEHFREAGEQAEALSFDFDDVCRYSPNENMMGSHIAALLEDRMKSLERSEPVGHEAAGRALLALARRDAAARAGRLGISPKEYEAGSGVPYLSRETSPEDVDWWFFTIKCLLGHDKYGESLPCDVPKSAGKTKGPDTEGAVRLIRAAGGIPCIAHPLASLRGIDELNDELEILEPLGLMAVEAYSSKHTLEEAKMLAVLARVRGLRVTAGSDSHGQRGRAAIGTVTGPSGDAKEPI